MTNTSKPIDFRWIPESDGGTFAVDPESPDYLEPVPCFGTYDCYTCVGIWLPVSDTKCFIAHINCALRIAEDSYTRVVESELNAQQIDRQVKLLLTHEHQRASWGTISDALISRMVLVCPSLDKSPFDAGKSEHKDATWVGQYVVEAIKGWFDVPNAVVRTKHGGFVAKHPEGLEELLTREEVKAIKEKGSSSWFACKENGVNITSWFIGLPKA